MDEDAGQKRSIPVGAVLLAAGRAQRMAGQHKLLAEYGGVSLVRLSAAVLAASRASGVVVVTGHRNNEIEAQLSDLDIVVRFNPDHAGGMGSSLACGLSDRRIGATAGVLVMLADMPAVETRDIDRLIAEFVDAGGRVVIRAACDGQPGNPVILPAILYDDIRALSGDVGARMLIQSSGLQVIDVDIGPAALLDVDTPQAVAESGGILRG